MKQMKYNLEGERFGRLLVLGRSEERPSTHDVYWLCKCDCGAVKSVTTGHLIAGTVRSCGCIRKEQAIERFKAAAEENIKHGETGSPLYYVWHCMRQRCENPKTPAFRWYGEKGIKVCEEWQDYASFAKWAKENGYQETPDKPRAEKLSIDRIDSDGDYCPENCRWVTIHENTTRASKKRWEKEKRPIGGTRAESVV